MLSGELHRGMWTEDENSVVYKCLNWKKIDANLFLVS